MRTKLVLKLENLTEEEATAYLYSHATNSKSLLLSNEEIANLMEISVEHLLSLFESISNKVNSPVYYSD